MKKIAVGVLVLLALAPVRPADGEATSDTYTLENGLRVFLLENHALPLVHVVAGVNLGSKNEAPETNGLVHILEHYVLFRGTHSRSGQDISRDIRRHGAYYNAHTGQDIALFELTLPSGNDEFALRNQKDILFNLKIDQAALEAEKEVILEELSQLEDDPLRYATVVVYQRLFDGHPYSLPVAGTRQAVAGLTASRMESLYQAYFTPANTALAVVGDFHLPEMKKRIEDIFGSLPRAEAPKAQIPPAPLLKNDQEVTLEMDVHQAYCIIGLAAPDYNHPDQFAVDLLTEILGRGVNPLLGSALRGTRNLAENVSMAYHSHKHGGVLLVTITLNPRNLKAARREALTFLRNVRNLNFTESDYYGEEKYYAYDYLLSAKNQIRYLAEKSQEKGLNLATSLVRHMLLSSGSPGDGYLQSIRKVTSSDLRQAAGRYLSSGKTVVVSVVPSARERRP